MRIVGILGDLTRNVEDERLENVVRFLALAEAGKPLPAMPQITRDAAAQKEREDLEVNIANFREF